MKKLITEKHIQEASQQRKSTLEVNAQTLITPAAKDAAKALGIKLIMEGVRKHQPTVSTHEAGLVVIGSDHGGFQLKEVLRPFIEALGYQVQDIGTASEDPVDYPDFAEQVARWVARKSAWRGIMIDAVGVGSAMVANKIPGIRAAVGYNIFSAKSSREHNDANVLTLGGRLIGSELAKEMVRVFLATEFGGGRHQPRVDKIMAIETKG